jgi:hypothetical protein
MFHFDTSCPFTNISSYHSDRVLNDYKSAIIFIHFQLI